MFDPRSKCQHLNVPPEMSSPNTHSSPSLSHIPSTLRSVTHRLCQSCIVHQHVFILDRNIVYQNPLFTRGRDLQSMQVPIWQSWRKFENEPSSQG